MTRILPPVAFYVHSDDPLERAWTEPDVLEAMARGEQPTCSVTGKDAWDWLQAHGPTPEMVAAQKIIGMYGAPRFLAGKFPDCAWARDPADDTLPPWIIKRRAAEKATKAAKERAAA